jgi:hypothetical protein
MRRKRWIVMTVWTLGLAGMAPIPSADAAGSIRSVDFRNFTYDLGEGEVVTVTQGEYSRDTRDDQLALQVIGVDFGDINGDGVDDAAVWLNFNTGGTGQFSFTQVYVLQNQKPVLVGMTQIGDRADGGLHDVLIDGGDLVEDRYTHGEGACCPDEITRYRFVLRGKNKLSRRGTPKRRALINGSEDGEPVALKFLKGTSSATVYNFDSIEKLMTLSARAGQTLIVKPVITSDYRKDVPKVVITDSGTTLATVDGKPVTVKLPSGKVTLKFTGEGFADIAIR